MLLLTPTLLLLVFVHCKVVTSTWEQGPQYCHCFSRANLNTPQHTAECFAAVIDLPDEPSDQDIRRCLAKTDDIDERCKLLRLHHLKESFVADISPLAPQSNGNTKIYYLAALYARHPFLRNLCEQTTDFVMVIGFLSRLTFRPSNVINSDLYGTIKSDEIFKAFDSNRLTSEVDRICNANMDEVFCQESMLTRRIVKRGKITEAESVRLGWESPTFEPLLHAYYLNFIPLKLFDPERFRTVRPDEEGTRQRYVKEQMHRLFDLIWANDLEELERLFEILPSSQEIKGCDTGEISTWCLLRTVLDQAKQFVITKAGKKEYLEEVAKRPRKVISFNIDYRELLSQRQVEEVLRIAEGQTFTITNIARNIQVESQKSVGKRFLQLKKYFTKLEMFNQEKADADIAYVQGRVDSYQTAVKEMSKKVSEKLWTILAKALGTSIGGTFEELAIAVETINPLAYVFDGDQVSETFDALDEMGQRIQANVKAGVLFASWEKLDEKAKNINDGLRSNSQFHLSVRNLIPKKHQRQSVNEFEQSKSTFLENYNNYSPEVTQPELDELSTFFEEVIDNACDLIDDAETISDSVTEMALPSYCWQTKAEVQMMTEMYSELYEFQFELIEAMATYLQAKTGIYAAKNMARNYDVLANQDITANAGLPDETTDILHNIAFTTYVTHHIQTWQTVDRYCDVLTYQNGGQAPVVCKGKDTDIPSLLALRPLKCDSVTHEYVDIPVIMRKPVTGKYGPEGKGQRKDGEITGEQVDFSRLSFEDLYVGQPVQFQVPNNDWLIQNNWIDAEEKDDAFYVAGFELFMPQSGNKARRVNIKTVSSSNNKIHGSDQIYVLSPSRPFVFEYKEGKGAELVCRREPIENPYTHCFNNKPAKICQLSVDRPVQSYNVLYPSVLSRFDISVSGYENEEPPRIKGVMNLKAGVTLCKRGKKRTSQRGNRKRRNAVDKNFGCCNADKYWNAKQSECATCAVGSPHFYNYYCA